MLLNVLTVKDFSVVYLMIVKHETWSCKLIVVIDPYVWYYIYIYIYTYIYIYI